MSSVTVNTAKREKLTKVRPARTAKKSKIRKVDEDIMNVFEGGIIIYFTSSFSFHLHYF